MRILILADDLYNARQWASGLEKYTGSEVILHGFNTKNKLLRIIKWLWALVTIRSYISKTKPDIVIGYRITSYGYLAAFSGFKPVVLAAEGITDIWPMNHWTTPLKAALARYANKRADLIHAWGEHMTPSILENGGSREQLMVLPRGVDLSVFNCVDANKSPIAKGEQIKAVVTRSLYSDYGHFVILEAVKNIVSQGYNIHISFAGDGPLFDEMKTFTVKHNLEKHVTLLGSVQYSKIPELLKDAHFYLSMPETEGVSASLFEAMACGCFPIVSDLPANRAFIESGSNGNLIPVGNSELLVETLQNCLTNQDYYQKTINANLNLVAERADLALNMKKFVEKYQMLLNEKA